MSWTIDPTEGILDPEVQVALFVASALVEDELSDSAKQLFEKMTLAEFSGLPDPDEFVIDDAGRIWPIDYPLTPIDKDEQIQQEITELVKKDNMPLFGRDSKDDDLASSGYSWNKTDYKADKDAKLPDYGGYGSSYQGNSGKSTTPVVKCRHYATPVFYVGDNDQKVTYHAGSQMNVEDLSFGPEWMVINLLGKTTAPVTPLKGSQKFIDALAPLMDKAERLSIDWRDYGVPYFQVGFWKKLHETIVESGIQNVLIYCMGGHGRTGTALAAILLELFPTAYDTESAIKFVRKNYCKEAIESQSQIDYLYNIHDTLSGIFGNGENIVQAGKGKKSK